MLPFILKCFVHGQTVNRRPLTATAGVRSQVNPCEMCDGQSGAGAAASPSFSVLLVSFSPRMGIYVLLVPKRTGEVWERRKNQFCFENRGALYRNAL